MCCLQEVGFSIFNAVLPEVFLVCQAIGIPRLAGTLQRVDSIERSCESTMYRDGILEKSVWLVKSGLLNGLLRRRKLLKFRYPHCNALTYPLRMNTAIQTIVQTLCQPRNERP
jgi:hypothetical protein